MLYNKVLGRRSAWTLNLVQEDVGSKLAERLHAETQWKVLRGGKVKEQNN